MSQKDTYKNLYNQIKSLESRFFVLFESAEFEYDSIN